MTKRFGLPYARPNDDGSVTCPECGERCAAVNELQQTAEDAITKGAHVAYAQHYMREHDENREKWHEQHQEGRED